TVEVHECSPSRPLVPAAGDGRNCEQRAALDGENATGMPEMGCFSHLPQRWSAQSLAARGKGAGRCGGLGKCAEAGAGDRLSLADAPDWHAFPEGRTPNEPASGVGRLLPDCSRTRFFTARRVATESGGGILVARELLFGQLHPDLACAIAL